MPRGSVRPLTPEQVSQVLRGIASPPPSIPLGVAMEAMTVTATSMMSWCGGHPMGFAFSTTRDVSPRL